MCKVIEASFLDGQALRVRFRDPCDLQSLCLSDRGGTYITGSLCTSFHIVCQLQQFFLLRLTKHQNRLIRRHVLERAELQSTKLN